MQMKKEYKTKTPSRSSFLNDVYAEKILVYATNLLKGSYALEGINLLRALKENVSSWRMCLNSVLNLGVAYYNVSFLYEAYDEFTMASKMTLDLINKAKGFNSVRMSILLTRIQLQVCILHSEMGKHEKALELARQASKTIYSAICEAVLYLIDSVSKATETDEKEADRVRNNLALLNHLIGETKDMRMLYLSKEDQSALQEARRHVPKTQKFNVEMLHYDYGKGKHSWLQKDKILDLIQLKLFTPIELYENNSEFKNSELMMAISYLAISLYCLSTETRFGEKQTNVNNVLDSEHWLSRSLELAYMFMPLDAPILNQIITVHERFHGLDKMTIPEDGEVFGLFRVLRPLSKPKIEACSKSALGSPIMIRIQPDKVEVEVPSFTLQQITRNNKIRGFSTGRNFDYHLTGQNYFDYQNNKSSSFSKQLPLNNNRNPNINRHIHFDERANKSKIGFRDTTMEGLSRNKRKINSYMKKVTKMGISYNVLKRPNSIEVESIGMKTREKRMPIGLELRGKRMEETLDGYFFDKMQSENRMTETMRVGGNVYINNNINLYISKNANADLINQTFVRGQVVREATRRSQLSNRRRANNFILSPEDTFI